jgi:hypothetical protein
MSIITDNIIVNLVKMLCTFKSLCLVGLGVRMTLNHPFGVGIEQKKGALGRPSFVNL